jgi:polar amino acid transport system substrate-binding protein
MFSNKPYDYSPRGPVSQIFRVVAIAILAVFAMGLTACGSASSGSSSGSESPSSASKTIRVGYETGVPSLVNDVAEEVFTQMGYKVEMVPMTFDALIPSLQSGRIDAAAGGLFITPPRCQAVTFSQPNMYFLHAFGVQKGNPRNLRTLEDVAKTGATLGVPAGSDEARQAKAKGVKDSQISTYQDVPTALDAVKAGRVDAVAYDNVTLEIELAKPGYSGLELTEPVNPEFEDGKQRPYAAGIAFPKKDTELAKQYSAKQAEFFKDGTKATEFAKKQSVPAESVPKPGDPYTTEDYCAYAGA